MKKCEHPSELSEEQQQWLKEAATAAVDAFENYSEARTPIQAANYLTELSNRMFDLSSYLPEYCSEWGWRAHEEE